MMRFSSLQTWFWRRGTPKQEQVEESKAKGKKSIDRIPSGGAGRELGEVSGSSSAGSGNTLLPEAMDFAIGWYEPHGPDFCSDDSFAVLVPCYTAPPPAPPSASESLSKSQLWANVLSQVAMETKAGAAPCLSSTKLGMLRTACKSMAMKSIGEKARGNLGKGVLSFLQSMEPAMHALLSQRMMLILV